VCGQLALLSVAACSLSSSNPTERIGRTDEPIIGGPIARFSELRRVHRSPVADSPGYVYECSGILVAPNLVLTARHCVSDTLDQTFTCDSGGWFRVVARSVPIRAVLLMDLHGLEALRKVALRVRPLARRSAAVSR